MVEIRGTSATNKYSNALETRRDTDISSPRHGRVAHSTQGGIDVSFLFFKGCAMKEVLQALLILSASCSHERQCT